MPNAGAWLSRLCSRAAPCFARARKRALLRALLLALSLATPARALAQGGNKLRLVLFAGPMLLPVIGVLAASLGLRATGSPVLWRFLCALLGLNSALLGRLLVLLLVSSQITGALLLFGQLTLASAMLFTLPVESGSVKAKIVLGRLPSVGAWAVLPGLVAYWLAR